MHVEPRVFGWSLLHRRVLVHSQNRNKSKVRVRIEHVFDVVKRLWGFANARYRGITNNIISSGAHASNGQRNIATGRTFFAGLVFLFEKN